MITVGTREVTLSDSGGVSLIKVRGANSVTYSAPYGRSSAGEYEFELRGRSGLTNRVFIYGVTGKVKAVQ